MARQTQGKCVTCRVRYVWQGRPLLRAARCPRCLYLLAQTTHILKWPVVNDTPLEDVNEAAFAARFPHTWPTRKGGAQ